MSRSIRHWLVLSLLIFGSLSLKGQPDDTFTRGLREKLASYTRSVPFEDIYLHTDRETYIAGEYLWFSAYLFDRQSLTLSNKSSFAYIELLGPDNQPVSQTRIRLENGSGGGGLRLPDSLGAGEYILRAYTNWMKNFLPGGCFMKTVTIYNPFSEAIFKKLGPAEFSDKSDKNILFFPEGGRLLKGFVNKVGVRIFSTGNTRPDFKGYLSDGINDSIVSVVIDTTGIGSFEFYAKQGMAYRLVSEDKKYSFFLPVISQTGLALQVKQEANNTLKLTVSSENANEPGFNFFYFVICSGGNVIYDRRVNYSGKSTEYLISENTFSQGINQITLFDAQGNPACNRLVYKPALKTENIKIKGLSNAGNREKITLEILPDSGAISKSDLSNLSLSMSAVTLKGQSVDIDDYLITGDEYISGTRKVMDRIRISEMSPKTIDDYLLSLKSTWIKWEDIISGKWPEIKYRTEKEKQFLSGFYKGRNKTEANAGKILFLSKPGKIPFFKYAETDEEDHFEFAIRDKETSDDYIIQPAVADNNRSIEIESPFSQRFPEMRYVTDSTKMELADAVKSMSVNYQVEKIYGISDLGDTSLPVSTSPVFIRFYGKPDQELIMSDYISLPVMQEVFFELIPGVQVKTKKSKYGFYIQDEIAKYYYDSPPALIVDGVIIDDPSAILDLDPELVEKIDIIKSGYIVGDVTFSGIISVITKAGDFSNITMPANAVRIRKSIYDPAIRYKSPDYSTISSRSDRTPDFRNTLYWNHSLKPDNNGRIMVEIMTSDFDSDYEINLQGVSNGKLFSVRKTLTIK